MPNKYLAAIRRAKRRPRELGLVLPAALFIYIFAVILILLLVQRVLLHNRSAVALIKSTRGSETAQGGVQLGLARLSYRVSYVQTRVNNGTPLSNGTTYWLTDVDVQDYASRPADFWTANFAGVARPFTMLPDAQHPAPGWSETDFTSTDGGQTAQFTITHPTGTVTVTLFLANSAPATQYSGYNDYILYYGYDIVATDRVTGKSTHIRSYISDLGKTISIELQRSLASYNLFAQNNTQPDGVTKVWDGTSYTGPVYSQNTFYIQGNPSYTYPVQISTAASPSYQYKGGGSYGFTQQSVNVIALPSSLQESAQRSTAYFGYSDAPNAIPSLPNDTIQVTTYSVTSVTGGVIVSTVSVYILTASSASICMENSGGGTTTYYHIKIDPPYNHPCDGPFNAPNDVTTNPKNVTILQCTSNLQSPQMLIFTDSPLIVQGQVSDLTKLTLAVGGSVAGVGNDLVIGGSVTYKTSPTISNANTAATVVGLVSWEGNVVLSQYYPTAASLGSSNNTIQTVDGVIMAPNGGFGAQGYSNFAANYAGYNGAVTQIGAIIRKWALPTLSSDLTRGWGLTALYDQNLQYNKAPPYFPGNGNYSLKNPQNVQVVDLYRVY